MKYKLLIPLLAVVSVIAVSGCVSRTNYQAFISRCESTGGQVMVPPCGSPTDPNCPERESMCICPDGSSFVYKDIQYMNWGGCFV